MPHSYYDDRTTTLKAYYSRYLTEIRKLSQSSVNHYIDALNNISRRLKQKSLVENDIYEITDIVYLEKVRDILYVDKDFVEADTRGNRMYSAGLNNYIRFANDESQELDKDNIILMDIPLSPIEAVTRERMVRNRSDVLRVQSIRIADYCCEMDHSHESFIAESNHKPYMEAHHAIPMRFQDQIPSSLDVYANIICMCPVCHRKIHYGLISERKEMMQAIYANRSERLANSGIYLSLDEFVKYVV